MPGDKLEDWTPTTAQRRVRDAVAEIFMVEPAAVVGRGRRRPLPQVRHAAMWVIRQCFPHMSYPMIGRLFGGRDHSTVIHGVRNTEARRGRDAKFAELLDQMVVGFGVSGGGLEVNDEVRARMEAVTARIRTRGKDSGHLFERRVAEPMRTVLPKNDFSTRGAEGMIETERQDIGLRQGSAALAEALAREGMVCR
ncbi:hypothetical protein K3172_13025 [Qipengyuania sp. 6B39]|uniref:helix-turn-helix domain-containing protein n=1 Tax=Qipengyuania proteolytica TaxID=2867239 RepID=UPI001C89D4D7|nr:hypothetical protein [Qipengyuania proteolytica]